MANDRLTSGRPATGDSRTGKRTVESGDHRRILGLSTIASRSSKMNGPARLLAYAMPPARRIAAERTSNPSRPFTDVDPDFPPLWHGRVVVDAAPPGPARLPAWACLALPGFLEQRPQVRPDEVCDRAG